NNVIYHNTTEFMLKEDDRNNLKKIIKFKNSNLKTELEKLNEITRLIITDKDLSELFGVIRDTVLNLGRKKFYTQNTYGRLEKVEKFDEFVNLPTTKKIDVIYNIFTKLLKANSSNQGKLFESSEAFVD